MPSPPLGHERGERLAGRTGTRSGKRVRQCARCGHQHSSEPADADRHQAYRHRSDAISHVDYDSCKADDSTVSGWLSRVSHSHRPEVRKGVGRQGSDAHLPGQLQRG